MKRFYFANAETKPRPLGMLFANSFAQSAEGWVQLSPFGDFLNVDDTGQKVIQRIGKDEAQALCNEFSSVLHKIAQPLGSPWYVGHPDHPRFKNQPGHTDGSAKGRVKELAVRHDPACAVCAAFANSGEPCGDHGLFGRVKWNEEGEHLIASESFDGHSVNWAALPAGKEHGVAVWKPTRLKSVGFTNAANIRVRPVTLANEADDDEADYINPNQKTDMQIPEWLKLLAGFKADEEVDEKQLEAALKERLEENKANEKADTETASFLNGLQTKFGATALPELTTKINAAAEGAGKVAGLETQLANERTAFTAERKGRSEALAALAVRDGRITMAQRDAKAAELAAAQDFANAADALSKLPVVVKTQPVTAGLGGQNVEMFANIRERSAAWEKLMAAREQEFPNEDSTARYNAVAATPEGKQLLAQMMQPTKAA